jgi:CelD/BcsL family acetyltransferase involved in cellulose biosynthesis
LEEGRSGVDPEAAGLRSELVTSVEALERHADAWDRLAMRRRRPYCSPAWMLSWWRHAAPEGAQLRSVLVFENETLVGVAPFYAMRRRGVIEYSLLAASVCGGIEPLAEPGREAECAALVGSRISAASPTPSLIRLAQTPRGSAWPGLLRDAWPAAPPLLVHEQSIPAPFIERNGQTFEQYFSERTANFRAECRRHRRQFESRGMVQRMARSGAEAERDLRSFAALHYSRWEARGGTGALRPALERMLESTARELVDSGRMRIVALDVGTETASVQIFVAAGGEVAYWLGGFDEQWAAFGPGNLAVLTAVEDFFSRGEERFDLGPGGQRYKYRFATGEGWYDCHLLIPKGRRLPLVLAVHLARRLKLAVARARA